MKPPKLDPGRVLAFGFLGAPIACALNSLVLQLIFNGVHPRLLTDVMNMWFSSLILTFPLGWMTARLMEIWQKGCFALARWLGLGCGLSTIVFWLFLASSNKWDTLAIGAFALPFFWSVSLLLFAVFARLPKA